MVCKYARQAKHLRRIAGFAIVLSLHACASVDSTEPLAVESQDSQGADQSTMLTEQSLLTPSGIGPIQIGMTVAEAAEAGAVELIGYGDASEPGTCTYVRPESGPPN